MGNYNWIIYPNADTNLYHKSLIAMREEAKLEFTDSKLGEEYKTYMNNYK